jgi:hypothetical protein
MLKATHRPPSLAELADRHACDKGSHGPSSRWMGNNYVDVYEAYFADRRDEPLKLLEIGIGVDGPNYRAGIAHGRNPTGGASMKMWADYFPNASITGADINPASWLDNERIATYQFDQGSRESIVAFIEKHSDPSFDIIIDDASHFPHHQQITLEMLFPHLKPGGIYFIEDLHEFGHGGRQRRGYPDIVPTRDLLRHYAANGDIIGPNAFQSVDFLAEVSEILFYSPRPMLRPRDLVIEALRSVAKRAHRGISRLEWADNSERLVALRKQA